MKWWKEETLTRTHKHGASCKGVTDHMLMWQPSESASMAGLPAGSAGRAETEKCRALQDQIGLRKGQKQKSEKPCRNTAPNLKLVKQTNNSVFGDAL